MNIAVLGYGVVGSGVVEVIKKNKNSIALRAGEEINVTRILDIRDFPDSPDRDLITKDPEQIFNDPSIKIVTETIGGTGVAYEFTKRALMSGRHVVTSNKELVALHGPELIQLAKQNGVNYLFEASVGGGIPIIRPLSECLAANEISQVMGILNGTTNYILTQMRKHGKDFNEALKEAQMKGYAEANPTNDIEGFDACRKIAILSSIAYNEFVDYREIHTEGISKITSMDMQCAELLDSVIKLIALSKKAGDKIYVRVSPMVISKTHPLASVDDVFNAILVKGNAIGDVIFYGQGAGKLPTASAVVADIIEIVKNVNANNRYNWERRPYSNVADTKEMETQLMIRTVIRNREEARRFIVNNFGDVRFLNLDFPGSEDQLVFITERNTERNLMEKAERLKGIASIKEVANILRIETE